MTGAARPRPVPVELLVHLRRARDHMDLHYAQELDLAAVAAVAGVSKYHFVRAFEATYGETPMRYLGRRRIERAQDLLRHANLTVTEICTAVGFSSLGSFSSRFTRLVGMTPSAYRDRWATRSAHVPGCWLFMRGVLDLGGTAQGAAESIGDGPRSGPAQRRRTAQSWRSPVEGPGPTVEP